MNKSDKTISVSVVIPTIGRPELLSRALESISKCDPGPEEIAVVDQSRTNAVAEVVSRFEEIGARRVECDGIGEAKARNTGLRAARHDLQLWTDDDCTVAPDWVERGWTHLRNNPGAVITGRVMPAGDPLSTPSIKIDPRPHDYVGSLQCSVLFPNNMGLPRQAALAIGGFDERLPMAVDNDFCYRWLTDGFGLLYRPDLVVWHHDWRSADELREVYRRYAHGQGMFCAKHLRAGDLRVLRFIASDVYQYGRSLAVAAVKHRPAWSDWRRGIPRGMFAGLTEGWRVFAPKERTRARRSEPRSGDGAD